MITKPNWSDLSGIDGSTALSAVNRVLPPWVGLLLVIAIAWQIARIIWMLVPGPAAGDSVPLPAYTPSASVEATTAVDVQAIVDAHMFGLLLSSMRI
jgi:hypothetical protein